MNGNHLSEQVPLVKGPFNDSLEITSSKKFKQLLWILNFDKEISFFLPHLDWSVGLLYLEQNLFKARVNLARNLEEKR